MIGFDGLRHVDRPVAPAPAFARELRDRISRALAALADGDAGEPIALPDRVPTAAGGVAPGAAAAGADRHEFNLGLTPYITVHDGAAAIAWYRRVLGAEELVRYVGPDGEIGHCQLRIGDAVLMLADEYPDFGALSPRTIGGSPVRLNLSVPDVDAVWAAAVAAGAVGEGAPADQPYGERSCRFVDPFGHRWLVQTTIAHPTNAEVEAAMDGYTIIESDDAS